MSNGIFCTQIDLAAKLYPCFSLTNIFLLVETHAYNTSQVIIWYCQKLEEKSTAKFKQKKWCPFFVTWVTTTETCAATRYYTILLNWLCSDVQLYPYVIIGFEFVRLINKMFYCGPMKIEKLKKCNVSNAGIAQMMIISPVLDLASVSIWVTVQAI